MQKVYFMVPDMWTQAVTSRNEHEKAWWPEVWRTSLVMQVSKQKRDKSDKNTWRGVTLFSVGSNLVRSSKCGFQNPTMVGGMVV
jgi:hypothetical protein